MRWENTGVVLILCTIVMGVLLLYKKNRAIQSIQEEKDKFWAREAAANNTRRKDISGLNYITIPVDTLPFVETDIYDINDYQKQLRNLADQKIINLTGISNTDLKLEYGVANLNLLSEYDENCTRLYTTLANLGYHLSQNGFHAEAIAFLEFGIECGTDVSRNYYILADEYLAKGDIASYNRLVERAKEIPSLIKDSIVKELLKKKDATS